MSATNKLQEIRTLLGLKTKLEQMKLENGTVLEADKFESDQPVFIITEDEKVALPIGDYKMESGETLSVVKEGVIASFGEEIEEEVKEEEIVEEEETEDLGYVSREEFNLALEEIKKMIDDLKPKEEEEKEEVEEVKEDVKEEEAELKAELSKPASAPLKHNPEASTEKRVNLKYGQNKQKSTFDIILEKLNK